ncbi:MAG: diadenylate cyclase CdaA [Gemmataceae bacterium]
MTSVSWRDLVEISLLSIAFYWVIRLLGRTRGAGLVRGLGMLLAGIYLAAQILVSVFDLTILARVLDYLMTTGLLAMVILFQPELRRGLFVLGRYPLLRAFVRSQDAPLADPLAKVAELLSRDRTGALIVLEREVSLEAMVESGTRIDAEISDMLLASLFFKNSPLHDGAVILRQGRIAAAGCQLPLGQLPDDADQRLGMRHRAALSVSEETDALVLVVSEESGRISLVSGGTLEPVPRDSLSRRLAEILSNRPAERGREAGGSRATIQFPTLAAQARTGTGEGPHA